jgi:WD40 repeat protein
MENQSNPNQQSIDNGQGFQVNDPTAPIVQGNQNTVNFIYQNVPLPESNASEPLQTRIDPNLSCPYRGLLPFREEDECLFFGRETFTAELEHTLQRQSLVTIIGSSGSGKSSVVFAGLVPLLRRQGTWLIQAFRPSDDRIHSNPFKALAAALVPLLTPEMNQIDQLEEIPKLADKLQEGTVTLVDVIQKILQNHPNHQHLLLIADQFEEVYATHVPGQDQFIDGLLAAVQALPRQLKLIVTIRADFLSFALNYPPLGDALQKYPPQLLGAMTSEELRSAIEKPLQKQQIDIAEGLIERILSDIRKEPGNLPLLEFALTELWAKQSQGTLTHQAYQDIGGVTKALANYAEAIYDQFSEPEKPQVRRIFLQLVRPGDEADDTRRLARADEVGEENWSLVTRLADHRLVVTNRDETSGVKTVELVHEALIREWERLHQWMENSRAFRTWQRRLRSARERWIQYKDDGALLRGAFLAESEGWMQQRSQEIGQQERAFIQSSVQLRDRSRRHLIRGLAGISIVTSVLAASVGLAAWNANRQRTIAEAERLSVNALQQFEVAPIEALVLALQGGQKLNDVIQKDLPLERYPTVSPLLALQTILDNIQQLNQFDTYQKGINSITFNPDGNQIATGGEDGKVKLWDFSGKEIVTINAYPDSKVNSVRFSPDKKLLATAGENGIVKLWDLSGKLLHEFVAHPGSNVKNVRFGNDSNLLVTTGRDGQVKLWNLQKKCLRTIATQAEHPECLQTISAHEGGVEVANFSEDYKLLITAGRDKVARLWNRNGTLLATFVGHQDTVKTANFSSDSKYIITAGEDDTVRIWNQTGTQQLEFKGKQKGINSARFFESKDSLKFITAGNDGTIKIWNSQGILLKSLKAHQGKIESIRLNKKDSTLATAGQEDGSVKLWKFPASSLDLSEGFPRIILKGHRGIVTSVRFNPKNNQQLVTASRDGTIRLWALDGKQTAMFSTPNGEEIETVRFHPKRDQLVTGGKDSKVRFWSMDGKILEEFSTQQEGGIRSINFHPDGDKLATTGSNSVKLWDLNGKFLKEFKHEGRIGTSRFSQDGGLVATVGENSLAWIWKIDGTLLKQLPDHKGSVNSVGFSQNGKLLATAGDDSVVRLWQIEEATADSFKPKTMFKTYQSLTTVAFSPGNQFVVTGARDGALRLWTLSGQQLAELKGHQDKPIRSLDFSQDSQLLVTASEDETAIIWRVRDLQSLLTEGCRWLNNNYLKTHSTEKQKLPFCEAQ